MKIFKKKYLCLNYGTIGDMLMMVSFLEEIHQQDRKAVLIVGVFKNFDLIKDLTACYDWLVLYDLSKKWHFIKIFPVLFLSKTTVIGPLTFGDIPRFILLFAKAVSFFNSKNSPIGFLPADIKNKEYFSKNITFHKDRLFIENLVNILAVLGFKEIKIIPHFNFIFNKSLLQELSLEINKYVIFHLCAANESRSLPKSRWVSVLRKIKDFDQNLNFVFTASKQDLNFVEDVLKESAVSGVIVVGRSLHDIATLIKNAKLYVGVDTGITHIAAVLRAPSVVLGNNSNPTWLPSYNPQALILKDDSVCSCDGQKGGDCFTDFEGKKYYRCMFSVTDDKIVASIKERLI